MSNEADNYEAINRRMREITGDKPRPAVAEEHERKGNYIFDSLIA